MKVERESYRHFYAASNAHAQKLSDNQPENLCIPYSQKELFNQSYVCNIRGISVNFAFNLFCVFLLM